MILSMCTDWPSRARIISRCISRGYKLVGGDKIEVGSRISQYLFPRRQVAVEHAEHRVLQAGERVVEHRAIKRFLVFEVVIKESLVHPGFSGNGVSAGAGNAVLGELVRRGPQNGGPALFGLAAGTHAGQERPGDDEEDEA